MTIVTITDNNKLNSAQVAAIAVRTGIHEIYPIEEPSFFSVIENDDFLTTESEGYTDFFQFGNLFINRSAIRGIKIVGDVITVFVGIHSFDVSGDLPYTIDEMLSFSGASGGGGGSTLGSWDMTTVGVDDLIAPSSEGSVNVSYTLAANEFTSVGVSGNDYFVLYGDKEYSTDSTIKPYTLVGDGVSPSTIFFGFANLEVTALEIVDIISNVGTASSVEVVTFYAVSADSVNVASYVFTQSGMAPTADVFPVAPTAGAMVRYDVIVSGSNYVFRAWVDGSSPITLGTVPVASITTGLRPFIVGGYGVDATGPVIGNFGGIAAQAEKPVDAVFGSRYLVTAPGSFYGVAASTNDIAEFIGTNSILVTKQYTNYVTSSQLDAAIASIVLPEISQSLTVGNIEWDMSLGSTLTIDLNGTDLPVDHIARAQYKRITCVGASFSSDVYELAFDPSTDKEHFYCEIIFGMDTTTITNGIANNALVDGDPVLPVSVKLLIGNVGAIDMKGVQAILLEYIDGLITIKYIKVDGIWRLPYSKLRYAINSTIAGSISGYYYGINFHEVTINANFTQLELSVGLTAPETLVRIDNTLNYTGDIIIGSSTFAVPNGISTYKIYRADGPLGGWSARAFETVSLTYLE